MEEIIEEIPAETFGAYVLLEHLGGGGNGIVHKAKKRYQPGLEVIVAIKRPLSPDGNDAIREEARNWIKVNGHPNILGLHEVIQAGNTVALVTEYSAEGTLRHRLDRQIRESNGATRHLPIEECLRLIDGVLNGLAYLHAQNPPVVHLDIKPGNVALIHGVPKLMDFGISRPLSPGMTHSLTEMARGTLCYMPIEILESGLLGCRSDIWSTGIMFCEMLTGDLPFNVSQYEGLVAALNSSSYERTSRQNVVSDIQNSIKTALKSVPTYLRPILTRALQYDREKRYPSAAEMLSEFREAVETDRSQESITLRRQITEVSNELEEARLEISAFHREKKRLEEYLNSRFSEMDSRLKETKHELTQSKSTLEKVTTERDHLLSLASEPPQEKRSDSPPESAATLSSNSDLEKAHNPLAGSRHETDAFRGNSSDAGAGETIPPPMPNSSDNPTMPIEAGPVLPEKAWWKRFPRRR